jgi:hypothetical protein
VIIVNLPETRSSRMELVENVRTIKSGGIGPSFLDPVSWIELSEPASVTLNKDPAIEDKELAQFLAAEDTRYRYDYVRLGCTFRANPPERFEKAWLTVALSTSGAPSADGPISWSIAPVNDYDLTEETTSAEIGSSGKILSAKIGAGTKMAKKVYSLRAFREGNANPYWELTATDSTSLEGILRFHMVVRSPAKSSTTGQVRMEAVISDRSFVAFRQKRPFDQTPSQEFHLTP